MLGAALGKKRVMSVEPAQTPGTRPTQTAPRRDAIASRPAVPVPRPPVVMGHVSSQNPPINVGVRKVSFEHGRILDTLASDFGEKLLRHRPYDSRCLAAAGCGTKFAYRSMSASRANCLANQFRAPPGRTTPSHTGNRIGLCDPSEKLASKQPCGPSALPEVRPMLQPTAMLARLARPSAVSTVFRRNSK